MPFNNFESRHFTTDEVQTLNEILLHLEDSLKEKLANLSPLERQQMGSINEKNKLVVNKVKDFHDSQPQLSSPDVDWDEFNNDFKSREFLQALMSRLEALIIGINNAKILHDRDNYVAALTDYDYTKYKNSTANPGFEAKETELSQFFTNRNAWKNKSEELDEIDTGEETQQDG